jgi:uncharacterized membrane protein YGL010W
MNDAVTRPIDAYLAHYSESHRHPTNELIHCVCVPAIAFSVMALLWAIHPLVAVAAALVSLAYYVTLSVRFALGMFVMFGAMAAILYALPRGLVLPVAAIVFVVAWIGQFIGHKIEGKKPSFFEDVRYLLIGPLFVLGLLYRRLHVAY